MLGAFHNAYRATLTEQGAMRTQAATALLFIAGGQDSVAFARQVSRSGVYVSPERLDEALTDATQIATDALENRKVGDPDFRHGLNVQWLADTFIASGCQNSVATTSRTNVQVAPAALARRELPSKTRLPEGSLLIVLVGVLVAGALILFGAHKLYNSFTMRRRRAERLPRVPIVLPIKVAYAFPDGEQREVDAKAVDISLGGMKLSWSKPPGPSTVITAHLLDAARPGQITWSNSFYAGIMFEKPLTDTELKECLALSQPLPA